MLNHCSLLTVYAVFLQVLSSTNVEVVGAYGVMDIEGSPGELEVLLEDNRTLLISQEKWDPIAAKMRAPPILLKITFVGNRVETAEVCEEE
ncbi:hypothetical protein EYF80_063375 [Liparis tanakae]|uniref:Uncharacterized protein n=1 Tax=Liparis tanakae TaxID=230148 RepID=A0A4Z2ECK0_9TELE|nr:hypothetical protein EYF80_063375 [Liparis tanakae]